MAEELEVGSQQDLFNQAVQPEPTPAPEPAPAEPAAETPPPAPAPEPEGVPSWRLREEADARRLAEDRARALEARLNEITQHLQQQQGPPKKNDFFENPDKATQELMNRMLQPYAEETRRTLMHLGKMVAGQVHGVDKVVTAEKAFLDAMNAGQLDTMDYERVVQAPNRYDEVVQWHKRQNALATVGEDPAAWFQKELESRLADPAFQASLLEKVKTKVTNGGTPSRAGGTAVVLPPSLSKATAAANSGGEAPGDLSDQSLFAFATRR
jgi:hypothetical protein